MACSNYAHWAIDRKGRDVARIFVTQAGIGARLYKDWLYIEDATGSGADTRYAGYCPPTVAEVKHGRLTYKDLHICAHRTEDGTFFLAAWTMDHPIDPAHPDEAIRGLYGIGRYAFDRDGRDIGIVAEHIQAFYEWLKEQGEQEDVPLPRTGIFSRVRTVTR